MSSFSLHIATDNAAFFAHGSPASMARAMELARILRKTADELEAGYDEKTVTDINGNTCGRYFWTDRAPALDDAAAVDRIAHIIEHRDDLEAGQSFLATIAQAVRLTGRAIAPAENDEDDDERDEIEPRGDYGPDEIDAQHIRDAGRGHLI